MPKYILSDLTNTPYYHTIIDVTYYTIIFISLVVSFFLLYKRLSSTFGYSRKQIRRFAIIMMLISYPAGVVSARAVNMFYFPSHFWNLAFFTDQLVHGKYVTFHAALLLPIALSIFSIRAFKFNFFEVWDTVFLYIPLGHAIGRVACLMVGCCWGNEISCDLFGQQYIFDNPIPLYAIFLNLTIFLFLRFCFNRIYGPGGAYHLKGLIISLYLIIYGNMRLLLELSRKEEVVSWGLTQAQIVMISFIIAGSLLFVAVMAKDSIRQKQKYFFSILLFCAGLIVAGLLYVYLVDRQVLSWPFRKVTNTADAYGMILGYLPAVILSLCSVYLLKIVSLPIVESFKWKRISPVYYGGLVVSIFYAIFMLLPIRFGFHLFSIWPSVIILSILNAVSEEIAFRLVLYRLLKKAINYSLPANAIQSLAYSIPHFFIGGSIFAVQAFFFGLLLGFIMEKNKSIVPCMICHFIVDLGAIGYPILTS